MSQYTDYIKEAARDFEEIERFESVSCLYAQDGRIETRYVHGGAVIEFLRDTTYYGDAYFKGDIIEEPPTDSYYVSLKNKWEPKQKPGIFKKLIARLFG